MPLSQLVLPSFTFVLNDSITLHDFQRAQNREVHLPVFSPSSDEDFMRTVDLRMAPAQAFIVYKCTYHPEHQDAASLFDDANQNKLASGGLFWRRMKMILLKFKRLGSKLFTA